MMEVYPQQYLRQRHDDRGATGGARGVSHQPRRTTPVPTAAADCQGPLKNGSFIR